MKRSLLIGAACTAMMFSSAAFAQSCEGSECSPTPSPPPSLPNTPSLNVEKAANFFAYPSGQVVQGGATYGATQGLYVFGVPGTTPFDNAVHTYGDTTSSVSIQADVANAAVTATAHQADIGRSSVGVALYYGVKLTASDPTTADAIAAILAHNPLAVINGSYTLSASGTGLARANGSSSYGPNNGHGYNFYAQCGQTINNSTCGTGNWSMLLGFQRGTAFNNGDANSFYGQFYFGGDAQAGCGCSNTPYPGDATAFIDPSITLNSQLQQYGGKFSLSSLNGLSDGGFTALTGGIPEPSQWALMLGGFGMLGGAMRRRRTLVTA